MTFPIDFQDSLMLTLVYWAQQGATNTLYLFSL